MIDRRRLLQAVRYALALAALAWLVRAAAWDRVFDTAVALGAVALAGILLLSVLETLSRFATWHVLLNRLGSTPFSTAAGVTLAVSFVNHLSPSQAVGRSLAPAVLRQYTDFPWSSLVAVAGTHTALYALCYGAVALVGFGAFGPSLSWGLALLVGGAVGAYLLVGALLWLTGRHLDAATGAVVAVHARIPFGRVPFADRVAGRVAGSLPDFSADSAATFRRLTDDRAALGTFAVGWSIAMLVVPGVRTWVLLEAAGVSFQTPLLLPLALVTSYAVTLLPVTPGGIGVAEASATLVLASLGVPAGVSAGVILVDRFLGVYLPAMVGWYPAMRLDVPSALASNED